MMKEYLGIEAVGDLFDIIDENYVSREDLEARDKKITSSKNVGSALPTINKESKGEAVIVIDDYEFEEVGGEGVDENMIATDLEVGEVLGKYFDGASDTFVVPSNNDFPVDESNVATEDEVDNVLNKYF